MEAVNNLGSIEYEMIQEYTAFHPVGYKATASLSLGLPVLQTVRCSRL